MIKLFPKQLAYSFRQIQLLSLVYATSKNQNHIYVSLLAVLI